MGTDGWSETDKREQDKNMTSGDRDMAGQDGRQAATPTGTWGVFNSFGGEEEGC